MSSLDNGAPQGQNAGSYREIEMKQKSWLDRIDEMSFWQAAAWVMPPTAIVTFIFVYFAVKAGGG